MRTKLLLKQSNTSASTRVRAAPRHGLTSSEPVRAATEEPPCGTAAQRGTGRSSRRPRYRQGPGARRTAGERPESHDAAACARAASRGPVRCCLSSRLSCRLSSRFPSPRSGRVARGGKRGKRGRAGRAGSPRALAAALPSKPRARRPRQQSPPLTPPERQEERSPLRHQRRLSRAVGSGAMTGRQGAAAEPVPATASRPGRARRADLRSPQHHSGQSGGPSTVAMLPAPDAHQAESPGGRKGQFILWVRAARPKLRE